MDAVLFDNDGVIVDTEDFWIEYGREILEEALAEDFEAHDIDPADFAGVGVYDEHAALEEREGVTVEVSGDEYFDLYERYAAEIYLDRARLMEGFRDLVRRLHEHDVKCGVVSGSWWVHLVLDRFDLGDAFDVVVGAGEVDEAGLRSKPEPDPYELAAERLGVDPSDCLAVEDSTNGIEAANRAGMEVIGYGDSSGQDLSGADEMAHGPDELMELIFLRVD